MQKLIYCFLFLLLANTQLIFAQNKGLKYPTFCGIIKVKVNNRPYTKISWQPLLDTTIIGYKIISIAYNGIDTFTIMGRNTESKLVLDSFIPGKPARIFKLAAFDAQYKMYTNPTSFNLIVYGGVQLMGVIHCFVYPIDNVSRHYFRRYSKDNGKTFIYVNSWISDPNKTMEYQKNYEIDNIPGLWQLGTLNTCDTNQISGGSSWIVNATGMKEQTSDRQLLVYPNPATDEINFVFSNAADEKEYNFVLLDPCGRTLTQFTVSNLLTKYSLLPLNLTTGIYFLKEINGSYTEKLIIK